MDEQTELAQQIEQLAESCAAVNPLVQAILLSVSASVKEGNEVELAHLVWDYSKRRLAVLDQQQRARRN